MAEDEAGRALSGERAADRRADRPVQLAEPAPGVRGLQRLDHRPHLHQGVAQVGALVAAVLPGAAGRLAEVGGAAGAQRAHRQRPPARHRLLARPRGRRSSGSRRGVCAGRGSRRRACRRARAGPRGPASPRVSSSSETRMTSGSPGPWASAADDLGAGLEALGHPGLVAAHRRAAGRTRTVTSGMTPSTPSEPTISSRSAGPAAVCGVSSVCRSPAGAMQADRADQGVEAPVAARGLAGRAGRGEAADRRVLEGLREVAEGQALRAPAPPPPRARAGRRRGSRSASGGRPRPRAGRRGRG